MKKYRIVLLIIFTLFLTGCNANYNLKIDIDGSVTEEGTAEIEDREYSYKELSSEERKKYAEATANKIECKDYRIEYKDKASIITLNNEYRDIFDYLENSNAYKMLFKDIKYSIDKDSITVEIIPSDYDVTEPVQVKVSLPFKVLYNNADDVDIDNNIYIWNIEDKEDTIKITYNNSKLTPYTYNILKLSNYFTGSTIFSIVIFLVLIIFIILVIIFAIKVVRISKSDFV